MTYFAFCELCRTVHLMVHIFFHRVAIIEFPVICYTTPSHLSLSHTKPTSTSDEVGLMHVNSAALGVLSAKGVFFAWG